MFTCCNREKGSDYLTFSLIFQIEFLPQLLINQAKIFFKKIFQNPKIKNITQKNSEYILHHYWLFCIRTNNYYLIQLLYINQILQYSFLWFSFIFLVNSVIFTFSCYLYSLRFISSHRIKVLIFKKRTRWCLPDSSSYVCSWIIQLTNLNVRLSFRYISVKYFYLTSLL